MQPGQALADHLLTLLHGMRRGAAGVGRFAGAVGHLLDGGLQLAERIANLCRVAGLALRSVVQVAAHFVQIAAAGSDLLGLLA
ncbi:hypothetical protein D3C77_452250 [compost metagenome]